jgi:hypothetical protein
MTQTTPIELEARLNAHRELLVQIVAMLLREGRSIDEALGAPMAEAALLDHEEDPGVLPSEAYSMESVMNDELRSLLRDGRKRMEATGATGAGTSGSSAG